MLIDTKIKAAMQAMMLVACFMLKLLSGPQCKRWPTARVARPKARCNPPPLVPYLSSAVTSVRGGESILSKPLKIQIVERARALIADEEHWCRGELARDARGMGVCLITDSAVKRCQLMRLPGAIVQPTILQSEP